MAKKKQKFWFYVLVMTNEGPTFVTEVDTNSRTARWDKDKPPLELYDDDANYLCLGLCWHGTTAYPVRLPFELTNQPYHYDKGHFKWTWTDGDKHEDDEEDEG